MTSSERTPATKREISQRRWMSEMARKIAVAAKVVGDRPEETLQWLMNFAASAPDNSERAALEIDYFIGRSRILRVDRGRSHHPHLDSYGMGRTSPQQVAEIHKALTT